MSNSFSFVGRIGKDPELKDVGQSQVLEFSIAHDVGFGDRKVTNWVNAKIWGKKGVGLSQHLTKGSQVFVSGELTLREYADKEGAKRLSPDLNVNALDFVGSKGESRDEDPTYEQKPASPETDSDLPF